MDKTIYYMSLAFIANFISLLFFAAQTSVIAYMVNERINVLKSLYVHMVTQIIGVLSPFKVLTITSKPFVIKHYSEMSFKKSGLITLLVQFAALFSALLAIVILILINWHNISTLSSAWIIGAVFFLVSLSLIAHKQIFSLIMHFYPHFPVKLKKFMLRKKLTPHKIVGYIEKIKVYLLNPRMLAYLLPLILAQILIQPLILFFLARAYSFSVSYSVSFIAFWIPVVLGMVSGIPGGAGVRDVSIGAYLVMQDIPVKTSLLIVAEYRIIVLATVLIIGIPQLVLIGKKKIKSYYTGYKHAKS